MRESSFNIELINNPTKEFAYILGFLWADGYLLPNTNTVSLEIVEKDAEIIKETVLKTGNWIVYNRVRSSKDGYVRQKTTKFHVTDNILRTFLEKHDYTKKSFNSFKSIYYYLPEGLRKYFLRGYIDGDGCIYASPKNNLYQFHISSTINQDWSIFNDIFKPFNINYHITKRNQIRSDGKINKSSKIQTSNADSISNFFAYIYDDFVTNNIGLLRKYNKFVDILNRQKTNIKAN
jgi:hypothetical protein